MNEPLIPGKIIAHIAMAPAHKATRGAGFSREPERIPSSVNVAIAKIPNTRYSGGAHFLTSRRVANADAAMTPKKADDTITGLS
jgi:hypothetical protein